MVDIENHRNVMYSESCHDSYHKTDFSRDRCRSNRSSRNDDNRYQISHKKYASRRNDFSNDFKSRSRSRSRDRFELSNSNYVRRNERNILARNPHFYTEYNDELNISKSNRTRNNISMSPLLSQHFHNKNYQKVRRPLLDLHVNSEFDVTVGTNKCSENLNICFSYPNLFDEKKIHYDFKKSLLGDGPEEVKINSTQYHSDESLRQMGMETVALMNSQYYDYVEAMQHKSFDTAPESPVSRKLSDSNILTITHKESVSTLQIIDYCHGDKLNIPWEQENTERNNCTVIEEELILKSYDSVSESVSNENGLEISKDLDSQIKDLANLLTQSETKENKTTWRLIPLFAPLRTRITEKDIDFNTCSEYDPRIAHIVQKTDF